jgi:hypothetical protein
MDESRSRTLKPGVALACLAAVAITLATGSLGGCTPTEYGSIDIEKSKAIAAERGIGPGASQPPSKKASRAPGAPTAPASK